MLEKVIAILSEVVVSNTAITICKEKTLPLDTRNYSSSVKRKQEEKNSPLYLRSCCFLSY